MELYIGIYRGIQGYIGIYSLGMRVSGFSVSFFFYVPVGAHFNACGRCAGFVTLNPKPQALNPKPKTLNPKPQTPFAGFVGSLYVIPFARGPVLVHGSLAAYTPP